MCLDIDEILQKKKYKPASYYKNLENNIYGTKNGTNIDMIISSLKDMKKPGLYEDYYIIACHLWGWKIPDCAHLEEIIMNHYDQTQEVFNTLPVEVRGRKSCISTQLRLWKHLKLLGFECCRHQFKIPQQTDSIAHQLKIWKLMCEKSNNSAIYYISD